MPKKTKLDKFIDIFYYKTEYEQTDLSRWLYDRGYSLQLDCEHSDMVHVDLEGNDVPLDEPKSSLVFANYDYSYQLVRVGEMLFYNRVTREITVATKTQYRDFRDEYEKAKREFYDY